VPRCTDPIKSNVWAGASLHAPRVWLNTTAAGPSVAMLQAGYWWYATCLTAVSGSSNSADTSMPSTPCGSGRPAATATVGNTSTRSVNDAVVLPAAIGLPGTFMMNGTADHDHDRDHADGLRSG